MGTENAFQLFLRIELCTLSVTPRYDFLLFSLSFFLQIHIFRQRRGENNHRKVG